MGLDIDFVPPGASLKGYELVLVPSLPHVSDQAEKAFRTASGMCPRKAYRRGKRAEPIADPFPVQIVNAFRKAASAASGWPAAYASMATGPR